VLFLAGAALLAGLSLLVVTGERGQRPAGRAGRSGAKPAGYGGRAAAVPGRLAGDPPVSAVTSGSRLRRLWQSIGAHPLGLTIVVAATRSGGALALTALVLTAQVAQAG
jgi:hypothetical protein